MNDLLITACIGINCDKKKDCLRHVEELEEGRKFADLSPDIFEECGSFIDKKRYKGKL